MNLAQKVRRVMNAIGLSDMSMHNLRHAHATQLLRKGTGCEHAERRVVGEDGLARQHMALDRVGQRLQQSRRLADPISQGRAVKIDICPKLVAAVDGRRRAAPLVLRDRWPRKTIEI